MAHSGNQEWMKLVTDVTHFDKKVLGRSMGHIIWGLQAMVSIGIDSKWSGTLVGAPEQEDARTFRVFSFPFYLYFLFFSKRITLVP